MYHHGGSDPPHGEHLGFLCCVSQWEIILFSLVVSFANTFFSIFFRLERELGIVYKTIKYSLPNTCTLLDNSRVLFEGTIFCFT